MALLPQTGYTAVTGIALPATRQLVWSVAATVQNTAYRRLLAGALWLCAPRRAVGPVSSLAGPGSTRRGERCRLLPV